MIADSHTPEFWSFIDDNINESPAALMLRCGGKQFPFDLKTAVLQIECRRKTATKLKSFNRFNRFYYPSALAAEQSSNEDVAKYHASLTTPGERVADLTAGLGIDAMTIAKVARSVTAFERNPATNSALQYNKVVCGISNMKVNPPSDSIEQIKAAPFAVYDTIFIDPARRDCNQNRTYAFADCEPDVVKYRALLCSKAARVLVKASPMLDISQVCRELDGITCIRVVAWRGECKEVLIEMAAKAAGAVKFMAVNISSAGVVNEYLCDGTENEDSLFPRDTELSGLYLYEPCASVMKLAHRAALCNKFPGLRKADANTNIYLSSALYLDFPGRIHKIEEEIKAADRKGMKGKYCNIVSRNYPLSPAEIKKRLGTKDGGDRFIYAFTAAGRKVMVLC